MKEGYIIKNNQVKNVNSGDMELINKYTRRTLTPDEVYVFSVVLCDNDIDRDFECFTKESLDKLAELFVGKTGITDHDAKSENQTARIFLCDVKKVEGKVTVTGEDYYQLVAKAYMPKIPKNNDIIFELDSGIKKEVSVGCAVSKKYCSVCGIDLRVDECIHKKGRTYETDRGKKLCYTVLNGPTDAYEWSFVAVPAQKNAGVIKKLGFNVEYTDINLDKILKNIKTNKNVNLSKIQSSQVADYITKLENLAKDGKIYKEDLMSEVGKMAQILVPNVDYKIIKRVVSCMNTSELKIFKNAFESKIDKIIPPKPQLSITEKQKEAETEKNTQFKI